MPYRHQHAFAVDPTSHNKVYAVSEEGLLFSSNFGATWTNSWTGSSYFEEAPQGKMIFDVTEGKVYVPTFSHGLLVMLPQCTDADNDGYSPLGGECGAVDCNDANRNFRPGAIENCFGTVDQNCSGSTGFDDPWCLSTCVDRDRDGFYPLFCGGNDCIDYNAAIYPGATEICDGWDNNCNGLWDEGFDLDGDHSTSCGGDCNDNDPTINPWATEIKNDGIDQDCNGYDLTIEITQAQWTPAQDGKLMVEATSDLGAEAALYVDYYGPMTWDEKKGIWELDISGIGPKPDSITVYGVEGWETIEVKTAEAWGVTF